MLWSLFHSPPCLLYMLMAALLPYDSGILPMEAHASHGKKLHSWQVGGAIDILTAITKDCQ